VSKIHREPPRRAEVHQFRGTKSLWIGLAPAEVRNNGHIWCGIRAETTGVHIAQAVEACEFAILKEVRRIQAT